MNMTIDLVLSSSPPVSHTSKTKSSIIHSSPKTPTIPHSAKPKTATSSLHHIHHPQYLKWVYTQKPMANESASQDNNYRGKRRAIVIVVM